MKIPPYKDRIIYQIYPLSFKDSNNDGIGDINGIISELPYLKSLGIGIIWLSPIYDSPMHDNGYDIRDYYKINPMFGTMDDFDNLLKKANELDIKIVMDLVINHTSNEHKWFKEALSNPNSKYRNYYIFEKGKNGKVPNNWQSAFSGTCWEKVPNEDDMYYMHLYTKEQPDLNYKNEEVIKEVENILEFYLKKGVYGFRCDVINQIYKTSLKNGKFRLFGRGKEYYESQPMNHVILKRIQDEVIKKYGAFLVGETSNVTPEIGNIFLKNGELDMFFEFEHSFCDENKFLPILKKKFKPKNLIKPIFKWQESVPWLGVYLENHDQRRSVSRYGSDKYYKESAKALSVFLLSLKGTIFIYEGEEIGMTDYKNYSYEDLNDCASISTINTAMRLLHLSRDKVFKMINETINRDHARSPMQWDNTSNAGFNNGTKTWLKVNENYKDGINVKDELNDPNSILHFYKKMISFRNSSEALKFGEFNRVKSNKNVAKFIRKYNDSTLLIIVNLSSKNIKDKDVVDKNILINTESNILNGELKPYQAIIREID